MILVANKDADQTVQINVQADLYLSFYSALKKWSFSGFTLSVILSVCLSVIIRFLFNILRLNGQNLTKFCIHIIIDKIYVGIVNNCFLQICNRVTAHDSRQNLVFTQLLENELT